MDSMRARVFKAFGKWTFDLKTRDLHGWYSVVLGGYYDTHREALDAARDGLKEASRP